jgi:hypothetical protein
MARIRRSSGKESPGRCAVVGVIDDQNTRCVRGLACTLCIVPSLNNHALPTLGVTLLDLLQGPFFLKCLSPLACSNCECRHTERSRGFHSAFILSPTS